MDFRTRVRIYYALAYGGTVPIWICALFAMGMDFSTSVWFLAAGVLCLAGLVVFDRLAMRCPYCRRHIKKPREHQLCPHCGEDLYLKSPKPVKKMKFRTKMRILYGLCAGTFVPVILSLLAVRLDRAYHWPYAKLAILFMLIGVAMGIGTVIYCHFVVRCPSCGSRLRHLFHSDFCSDCGAYLYQDEE